MKNKRIRFLASSNIFAICVSSVSFSTQNAKAFDLKYCNPIYWLVYLGNKVSYFFSVLSNILSSAENDVKMEQKVIAALNLIFSEKNVKIKNVEKDYKEVSVRTKESSFTIPVQRVSLKDGKYITALLKKDDKNVVLLNIKSTKDLIDFVGNVIKFTKNSEKNVKENCKKCNCSSGSMKSINLENDVEMERNVIAALNLIFSEKNIKIVNKGEKYKSILVHLERLSFKISVQRFSFGDEKKVYAILFDSDDKTVAYRNINSIEDLRDFIGVIINFTENSEKRVEEISEKHNDSSELRE